VETKRWDYRMFILQILVLLILVGVALWLVPRFLSRSVRKMPSRVPRAWVEEYRTEERGSE
jgi:flagellar biogenesis protein FliO